MSVLHFMAGFFLFGWLRVIGNMIQTDRREKKIGNLCKLALFMSGTFLLKVPAYFISTSQLV